MHAILFAFHTPRSPGRFIQATFRIGFSGWLKLNFSISSLRKIRTTHNQVCKHRQIFQSCSVASESAMFWKVNICFGTYGFKKVLNELSLSGTHDRFYNLNLRQSGCWLSAYHLLQQIPILSTQISHSLRLRIQFKSRKSKNCQIIFFRDLHWNSRHQLLVDQGKTTP